jgi:hypothetical protein
LRAAVEYQSKLKAEIELEKSSKQKAEQVASELEQICTSLKHRSLAFAIQRAREVRKAREAEERN